MDGDFQSDYLAAEQAYGAGDFEAARKITLELLSQLEPVPEDGSERDAVLAWRAFVALLAGHIELYGFQDPAQAESFYKLVLASNPQDTLLELAEQGLERTLKGHVVVKGPEQVADPAEAPHTETVAVNLSTALIADPFLNKSTEAINSVQTMVTSTAMPWLNSETSDTVPEQPPSDQSDSVVEPLTLTGNEPETAADIEPVDEPSESVPEQPPTDQSEGFAEPEQEPEPQPVSQPESETTFANIEPDGDSSDAGPEPIPSNQTDSEPETGDELLRGSETLIVTHETETNPDHEISEAVMKRLKASTLRVQLPEKAEPPSENSSNGDQTNSRWSWLRTALRRS